MLGDLVQTQVPGGRTPARSVALTRLLPAVAAAPVVPDTPGARARDDVATLLVNRRFLADSGIARLSAAILVGDGAEALRALHRPRSHGCRARAVA